MKKEITIFLGIIIVSVIAFSLLSINFLSLTGNVALEESINLGEKLSGDLILQIDEGDSLSEQLPILIALTKNNSIILTETLTLEKFIQNSDNPKDPVKKNSESFYEIPGKYNLEISNIIDYNFEEPGEYELLFSILDLDINTKKKFLVK